MTPRFSVLASNFELAARSGAWYWGTHNALMPYQQAQPHYPSAGSMNTVADAVTWSNPVLDTQRVIFDRITRGVNPGMNGSEDRWRAYVGTPNQPNRPALVHSFYAEGGNPYDAMAAVL